MEVRARQRCGQKEGRSELVWAREKKNTRVGGMGGWTSPRSA